MKSKFENSVGFTPTPDGGHSKIWSSKTTSAPLVWGFTLIELLIVMAIIVIISGVSLANWRGGEKQYALLRSANKLSQDLRRAEEMAMSAREFQGQIPRGGYGVYFKDQEKDHYILFADLNGNQHYDSGLDGLIEDVKIEKDIQISQLSASPLTIVFTPPDPTVTIKPDASTAAITLAIGTNLTKTRIIRVNKAGLVYIESCIACYPDADRDGYYSTSGSQICGASMSCPSGYSGAAGNDCNDGNASIYPGTSGGLTCSICQSNGTIAYQTSSQDLFNECTTTGCLTGYCKGDSYACGYYTSGEGNCAVCKTCDGATSGSCVNIANGTKDEQGSLTCTATHYRCNGLGSCTAPTTQSCVANSSYYNPCSKRCATLGYAGCTNSCTNSRCTACYNSCAVTYYQGWYYPYYCLCWKYAY